MPKRRIHPPEFKAQVALEALCSKKTLAEVAASHELHPVQVCQWKQQVVKQMPKLFRTGDDASDRHDVENLRQQLTKLERDNSALASELQWLKKKFCSCDQLILRSLLEDDHPCISLRRQCQLLGVTRSSYYYHPVTILRKSSQFSRLIDHLCAEDPGISRRNLLTQMRLQGHPLCKEYLCRLLCRFGFAPFERKLMRLLESRLAQLPSLPCRQDDFSRVGDQWILDIAFWPSPRADLFAALLVDASSQSCLAWGLSDRLSPNLVIDLLRVAMATYPLPFFLRCETYLPFLSARCISDLHQAGISLVQPLWLELLQGSGRSTALASLWKTLKHGAETLRTVHGQATEEWILQQAIRRAVALGTSRSSCGKILKSCDQNCGGLSWGEVNEPATTILQKCLQTRSFLTLPSPSSP
jgi:putative transposase